jgi:hypothetical protein
MSTASTTWGRSTVVGTLPVCPPASPPCTITASAPQAATFSACRRAPIEGMQTRPASLSCFISFSLGARAKDATFTPSRTISSARSNTSGASERRFTPNGRSVRSLVSAIARASSARSIVAEAMMPSPPAFAVADTRPALATQPMPVWTMG